MPSTATPKQSPIPPAAPVALHQPMTWLHQSLESDTHTQFVNRTRDICYGLALALQLVHGCGMDVAAGTSPILKSNDAERMMLLATTAAKMLGEEAEREIEFLNDRAQQGGAA
ncbi:hypothetical protein ACFDR9_005458 [Janthinobacterium sp. CG_23.3]|uniref:hypothetical protein n=1 Tax=Janthinobacterium sp. CG_23.3 TaxID=3349634 RepID=UPI0038D47B13